MSSLSIILTFQAVSYLVAKPTTYELTLRKAHLLFPLCSDPQLTVNLLGNRQVIVDESSWETETMSQNEVEMNLVDKAELKQVEATEKSVELARSSKKHKFCEVEEEGVEPLICSEAESELTDLPPGSVVIELFFHSIYRKVPNLKVAVTLETKWKQLFEVASEWSGLRNSRLRLNFDGANIKPQELNETLGSTMSDIGDWKDFPIEVYENYITGQTFAGHFRYASLLNNQI